MKKILFKININNEYRELTNDLIKYSSILIFLNIILHLFDNNPLFSLNYLKFMISILLAITSYWLIVNKLIEV